MDNFTFFNNTKILFGKGQIASIRQEFPAGSKILITYGGGSIKRNGVMEQVQQALGDCQFFEFGGIEPNPHFETAVKAAQLVRDESIDFILAVGGGSVIDATKFIAAVARYEGQPQEVLATQGSVITDAVPFGCVLTLAATGSEMISGRPLVKGMKN